MNIPEKYKNRVTITTGEASELTGMSLFQIRARIKAKELKAQKSGASEKGRLLIDFESFKQLIGAEA